MVNPLGYSGYVPDDGEQPFLPLELYPIVIREARYGGVYEGGSWFACSGYGFPANAIGTDTDCTNFWQSEQSHLIGRGDSPNEAVNNLLIRNGFKPYY